VQVTQICVTCRSRLTQCRAQTGAARKVNSSKSKLWRTRTFVKRRLVTERLAAGVGVPSAAMMGKPAVVQLGIPDEASARRPSSGTSQEDMDISLLRVVEAAKEGMSEV